MNIFITEQEKEFLLLGPITRQSRLFRSYQLTLEDYNDMLIKQDFCCKICHTHRAAFDKNFAVDHDHKCCPTSTKTCGNCIRGLLCSDCNIGLGVFRDNPDILRRAALYLLENDH